tara:strand:- start:272 stop:721 length:450 start_codon:yes stop_codon:yes gene_type:complete
VTKEFEQLIKKNFDNEYFKFYINDEKYYDNLSKIDFAFACSGTVHLELSFTHIPHFIFYKANFFNYLIFKMFVKSNYLSLVNIFNKKPCIKEFIQSNFKHNILMNEFENLYQNKDLFNDYKNLMIESLKESNIQKINLNTIIDYLKMSS